MKKAIIKILGKEYTAEGETAKEAINALDYSGFAAVKSLLTIKDTITNQERTIFLPLVQTKRLFSLSRLTKEIAIKQIAMRFE